MNYKEMKDDQLTLVDFYSGAGGFSEGYRQEGFKILKGYDSWGPAAQTFRFNHKVECEQIDILKLSRTIKLIETVPDSTVLTGSPPCISFSSSNRSGKADKLLGKKLMRAYLKIVAVKKFKHGSKLKAWYMENVGRSAAHLRPYYTFHQLGLGEWARSVGKDKNDVALSVRNNSVILNSADYGAPQMRKRLFVGEIIGSDVLPFPEATHSQDNSDGKLPYVTFKQIRTILPPPNTREDRLKGHLKDPNFPSLVISTSKLTDHFYDTGLRSELWERSKHLKTNHPFMGKMSFPEKEERPSRTIMATNISSSRESIILKCERGRSGDGEFRTLTVRESACLMGFPVTYQFIGSLSNKIKLVGNAVCPHVSRQLARTVKKYLGKRTMSLPKVSRSTSRLHEIKNLNSFTQNVFKSITKKTNKPTKFRMHLYKDGNLTVDLMNYDLRSISSTPNGKWKTLVFYSNGESALKKAHEVRVNDFRKLEPVILEKVRNGNNFIRTINNGFSEKIAPGKNLQELLDGRSNCSLFYSPHKLLAKAKEIIASYPNVDDRVTDNRLPFRKDNIPLRQVLALYALNKIATVANLK